VKVRLEQPCLLPWHTDVVFIVAIIYWSEMFRQGNAPVIVNLV